MKRLHYVFRGIQISFIAMLATSAFAGSPRPHRDGTNAAAEVSIGGEGWQNGTGDGPGDAQWSRAQQMFAHNDFAQASAAAGQVTSPAVKPQAQTMVTQIRAYVAALQAGVEAENRKDFNAAIQYYTAAAHIKSDGPGEPSTRIARLQGQEASADQVQQAQALQAQRALHMAQGKTKAALFAKKGLAQEQAGDVEGALTSFGAAQAAFPATPGVAEAIKRLQGKRGSGQVTVAEDQQAAPAIRDFYAGQYGKAEEELKGLTSRPNAKWLGAAFFYLGATRFERALLEAGRSSAEAAQQPEVQAAFRQARSLGYVPLTKFVSPVILTAWQGAL